MQIKIIKLVITYERGHKNKIISINDLSIIFSVIVHRVIPHFALINYQQYRCNFQYE